MQGKPPPHIPTSEEMKKPVITYTPVKIDKNKSFGSMYWGTTIKLPQIDMNRIHWAFGGGAGNGLGGGL